MRKDKARDIARGVLPSTARKSAREDKKNFHSKHRGQQRRVNDEICRSMNAVDDEGHIFTDVDLFDDFEEPLVYDGYHAATKDPSLGWDDMNGIVDDRRNADKLGPLIRWAHATHDRLMTGPEWATSDKVAYFRALLPDTLQGRHALGHVQQSLNLEENPYHYYWRYQDYTPTTKDEFRAKLDKILSTSKGRMAFHDFRLETVPAAAHSAEANNLVLTRVQAVDEEGNPLFIKDPIWGGLTTQEVTGRYSRRRPYMVDAYVPQPVTETCDDCAFLRDNPLFTADDITRFVDLVWNGVRFGRYRWQGPRVTNPDHSYLPKIREHVLSYDGGS